MKIKMITKEQKIHLCINMSPLESWLLLKGWFFIIILTKHCKTCFVECHTQQNYENRFIYFLHLCFDQKQSYVLFCLYYSKENSKF